MHEFMLEYAAREASHHKLFTNGRIKRTIGYFAVKEVKIPAEISAILVSRKEDLTDVPKTSSSEYYRSSAEDKTVDRSAEEVTRQSLCALRAHEEHHRNVQKCNDTRSERI